MEIEQLKLILDAVGSLSGEAKIIAIAWLSIQAIEILSYAVIWLGFFYFTYKLTTYIIGRFNTPFVHQIRAIILPGCAYGEISNGEKVSMLDFVTNAKAKANEEKAKGPSK